MGIGSDLDFELPSGPEFGAFDPPLGPPEFVLAGQQLELYGTLREWDERAGEWYRGALVALSNPNNPERFVHAAHSIRELMKNLHNFIDAPVQADGAKLGDKFTALSSKWEKAREASACHTDDVWDGPIDRHLRRALAVIDSTVAWYRTNRVTWKETSLTVIRQLDVSQRPLPPSLETARFAEWDALLNYFIAVCHHGRATDETEFSTRLYAFERFVLDRAKPKTSSEQATLDQLIAEAERGA
jgi:hypothetical protein